MDLIEFIPSETVKNCVREVGYIITPSDATCIVYNSDKPLKEKHQAYYEIINTMPDCRINSNGATLHSALNQYIATQMQLIELFHKKENGSFYQCCIYDIYSIEDANVRNLCFQIENSVYKTFDECIDALSTIPSQYFKAINYIKIDKSLIDNDSLGAIGITLINNEITDVSPYYVTSKKEKEHCSLWAPIANIGFSKNFPIPFKTGDIITCADSISEQNIAVVNIKAENKKPIYGFYAIDTNFDPQFIEFVPYSLLRAELINKYDLPQNHYIEIAISTLLKNEIDLGLFIKVYNHYKQSQTAVIISDYDIKKLKKHGIKIK